MKNVDGLISVSDTYIKTLKNRYKEIKHIPSATITFGAFEKDQQITERHIQELAPAFKKTAGIFTLAYIGRGGLDMHRALALLFTAFKTGLQKQPELFSLFRFNFIGTSYAPKGTGRQTVFPVAESLGLSEYVQEQTDRIPFYQGLAGLQAADGLVVPGSDDPAYTASKLYPYILAKKPLLGIFHPLSSAVHILKECQAGDVIDLNIAAEEAYAILKRFLEDVKNGTIPQTNWKAFEPYTAKEMTRRQCEVFDKVLEQTIN